MEDSTSWSETVNVINTDFNKIVVGGKCNKVLGREKEAVTFRSELII